MAGSLIIIDHAAVSKALYYHPLANIKDDSIAKFFKYSSDF